MVRASEITTTTAIGVAAAAGLASAGGAAGAGAGAGAGGTSGLNVKGTLSNPVTFWGFIETLQIMNYMLYLAAKSPDVLDELYKLLSLTNGSFMPDVFKRFVKPTGIAPPTPFEV